MAVQYCFDNDDGQLYDDASDITFDLSLASYNIKSSKILSYFASEIEVLSERKLETITSNEQQEMLEVGWVQLTDSAKSFAGPCSLDRFTRMDYHVLSGLFQPLGYSPSRFQGNLARSIEQIDVLELDYDNYVFSIKLDGIRAWLIAYKGVIYLQDKRGTIRRIGGIDSNDSFILDVTVVYYPVTSSYYYYVSDVIYDGEKCARMRFYERVQRMWKIPIYDIKLDKIYGSSNLGHVMFTKFFTLDMFSRVIYEDGLYFYNINSCYDFHESKAVIAWNKKIRTVNLYHSGGRLYSCQFERDGKRVKQYDFQGTFSKMIRVDNVRDNIVVECRLDILSTPKEKIFQFVGYRSEVSFPNSSHVVSEILGDKNNVSWIDLFRRLRKYKYFYGKKIYSLYDEGLGSKEYNVEYYNKRDEKRNFFLYEYDIPDVCFYFRPQVFLKYKQYVENGDEGKERVDREYLSVVDYSLIGNDQTFSDRINLSSGHVEVVPPPRKLVMKSLVSKDCKIVEKEEI